MTSICVEDKFILNLITFVNEVGGSIETIYKENSSFQKKNNLSVDKRTFEALNLVFEGFVKGKSDITNKIIEEFIENSSPYWDKIKHRDIEFLVSLVDVVFPHMQEFDKYGKYLNQGKTLTQYIDEISFFFGRNSDKKIYFNEEDINYFWEVIEGMVSLSIKYIIKNKFQPKKHEFDLKYQVKTWNITI